MPGRIRRGADVKVIGGKFNSCHSAQLIGDDMVPRRGHDASRRTKLFSGGGAGAKL